MTTKIPSPPTLFSSPETSNSPSQNETAPIHSAKRNPSSKNSASAHSIQETCVPIAQAIAQTWSRRKYGLRGIARGNLRAVTGLIRGRRWLSLKRRVWPGYGHWWMGRLGSRWGGHQRGECGQVGLNWKIILILVVWGYLQQLWRR